MPVLRVTARLSSADAKLLPKASDTAEVVVELPMPKAWNPVAMTTVLPVLAESMSYVLRSWLDDVEEEVPESELVFAGGEA
jgi:hypothetical protein